MERTIYPGPGVHPGAITADSAQAREWDKPEPSVHIDEWEGPELTTPPDPTWPKRHKRALGQLTEFFNHDKHRSKVP